MKVNLESSEPDIRIELIPLIDVIFCILTFFILAAVTLTRQTAIGVDIPAASTGTAQMRDMFIVSVDQIGELYIDKQRVSSQQLYQQLLQYHYTNPEGLVVLYASRLASYNDVIQVLDLLRSVGGDRVALATLPEGSQAQPVDPFSGFSNPSQPNPANPDQFQVPGGSDFFEPTQPLFPSDSTAPNSGNGGSSSSNNPALPTAPAPQRSPASPN